MLEYILGLSFIVFIFVMISYRNKKYEIHGHENDVTPIVRILLFIIVCIAYVGVGLQSTLIRMDINVLYDRLKVLPLYMGAFFYFIDYNIYSGNKDDIELAQKTLKDAFKNHIVFVLLMAFVLASEKFHFIEMVLGVIY